jgi:hypothetical protein
METKETIDLSCADTARGQYLLSLHSPSINGNIPLEKQYPEVIEHIIAKINQTLLTGGLFEKISAINGIKPVFFDQDGATIPQGDTLYKILEISKKNTGFIVDRLKECALSVKGWIANSDINKKEQFDIFGKMAELFANETKNDKFTNYTIGGTDAKSFSVKKLAAMQAVGISKYQQQ